MVIVLLLALLGTFGVAGYFLLTGGLGPRRYQERRLRLELLPMLGAEEIVTCRPRSAVGVLGPLCFCFGIILAFISSAILADSLYMVVIASPTQRLSPQHSRLLATGLKALTSLIVAFLFLRTGLSLHNFDCIVTDRRFCWRNGLRRSTTNACPLGEILDVRCSKTWLLGGTMWEVSIQLKDGSSHEMLGVENVEDFFEALGFEVPPPKVLTLWKTPPARRKVC